MVISDGAGLGTGLAGFLVAARLFTALLLLSAFFPACQTATPGMSLEEAKKVTVSFSGRSFVPPPRTISDITRLLAPTGRASLVAVDAQREADLAQPETADEVALGRFYFLRGRAARRIGRFRQAVEDFTRAAEYVKPGAGVQMKKGPWTAELGTSDLGMILLRDLAETQAASGNYRQAIVRYEHAIRSVAFVPDEQGWLFQLYASLAELFAATGDLKAAERTLGDLIRLQSASLFWPRVRLGHRANFDANVASAQATVLELRGRLVEAERFWRQSIAILAPFDKFPWQGALLDSRTGRLALCLLRQGRVLEAEGEARKAFRSAVSRADTFSFDSATLLNVLVRVLREQGRYAEAEALARTTIGIYQRGGASPTSSLAVTAPQRELAAVLVAQGRWHDGLKEYETLREQLRDDDLYHGLTEDDFTFIYALLRVGRIKEGTEAVRDALDRARRIRGDHDASTAELRGFHAMSLASVGDRARALSEFASATRILHNRRIEAEDESTTWGERDQRLSWILAGYIDLLQSIEGSPAAPPGLDPLAEAFRVADVARGRFVQRAVDASAARSIAKTPALAELVRREQDAKKEIGALQGLLATASAGPQDARVIADLRQRIEALQRARPTIIQQIVKEFPAYAQLVDPPPVTVEQVRASLRPGESLIATLVTEERTYVWAVPQRAPLAFTTISLGKGALGAMVSRLRRALDPRAHTMADIPVFDLETAHRLYRLLLEPVRSGWEEARGLLIVAHGPLGQLPFSVLPTGPVVLESQRAPLFANYRRVPWLIRQHAVTTLPSASALVTLRRLPPGPGERLPFVGFGDPYFSVEQAREAARETSEARRAAVSVGDVPVPKQRLALRDVLVSPAADAETSTLGMLPRLADTADEIRSMAQAMKADPTRDVFLGVAANEQTVKRLDLTQYRVIAFATHGLVPGDLDGLTQPALALTAPTVVTVEGDGLLTMEEILALRLNADWVVLSACNTANGAGTGAEAISGLGRAFFYAGARALLVTHWPVETRAARALTTELFRRQAAERGEGRARALQATMNWLIDEGGVIDPETSTMVFSFAHPIFWAPFVLVGDSG